MTSLWAAARSLCSDTLCNHAIFGLAARWTASLGLGLTLGLSAACKTPEKQEPAVTQVVASATPQPVPPPKAPSAPLQIGYSDWPGFVALEVPAAKGWFKEAGLDIKLVWFEYVPSLEAFQAGKLDAVGITNGDQLVIAASKTPSTMVLLTDYSNGNDMIVAQRWHRGREGAQGQEGGRRGRLRGPPAAAQRLEISGPERGGREARERADGPDAAGAEVGQRRRHRGVAAEQRQRPA